MKKLAIFTVLLSMCCAKIILNIKTSKYREKTKVNFSGTDVKLVTDDEVALFNITHENLNRGIRIELGKVPDDVFLRDPTPYEDLFNQYKWPEVRRVLTIKSAKIIEFIQQNVDIKNHEHINNTTRDIKSKTDMMEILEINALSLWSPDGLPLDKIHNNVTIEFGYGNWSFLDKWRDESVKFIHLPFGASKGIIDLKAGQTVTSTLTGIKIVMLIEIEFMAKLAGNIIADYENLYGKYHFYSPALQNIMKAAKLKNEIVTKEFLEVRFISNPEVKVVDKDTGEELNVEVRKRHWTNRRKFIFLTTTPSLPINSSNLNAPCHGTTTVSPTNNCSPETTVTHQPCHRKPQWRGPIPTRASTSFKPVC